MTVAELKTILSILDDDTKIYIQRDNKDEFEVKSFQITSYEDKAELCLSVDSNFGLYID